MTAYDLQIQAAGEWLAGGFYSTAEAKARQAMVAARTDAERMRANALLSLARIRGAR